jgi:uncharacterized protein
MKWISPQTITGPPAENKVYLRRQYINDEFWKRIENGEHILFSAPRRVGKSSIMIDLENNHPERYVTIYNNIESDKTQQDFFKRLLTLILEKAGTHKKLKNKILLWLKTKSVEEISIEGSIKFNRKDLNYKEELLDLVKKLGKESIHLVMLLDEFPEVIQNIKKNEGDQSAIDTLHTLRSIRHEKGFKNFSFAFAGSIGLNHVVSLLDRPKLINDLVPVLVEPLTNEEAHELTEKLLKGATMKIDKGEKDYLFSKISCLLPYYIQLMIQKCDTILYKESRPLLTKTDIDNAFILVAREGRNFNDWELRLKDYYGASDAKYCIAVLTRCAHFEFYTVQQAYDLSKTMIPDTGYKQLIDDVLIKDGYITEDHDYYTFLSPLFRDWWKKRHPKHEIEE